VLIEYKKDALKRLARMQPKLAAAFERDLAKIAANPFGMHTNVKALAGAKDAFRLRHGDWRALYWINRETQTVVVEAIVPRGGAYR
jgi:mRNA-degrading endonuclease RelE of RelBE toxin-antitoxin system